jgi:septal ring factor EnvC (AmiA/AmiB activator)
LSSVIFLLCISYFTQLFCLVYPTVLRHYFSSEHILDDTKKIIHELDDKSDETKDKIEDSENDIEKVEDSEHDVIKALKKELDTLKKNIDEDHAVSEEQLEDLQRDIDALRKSHNNSRYVNTIQLRLYRDCVFVSPLRVTNNGNNA